MLIIKSYRQIYEEMKASLLRRFPSARISSRSILGDLLHATSLQTSYLHRQAAEIHSQLDVRNRRGRAVDRTLFDAGMARVAPSAAKGKVTISDSALTTKISSATSAVVFAGATVVNLSSGDGSLFSTLATPFDVILNRSDDSLRENVTVSSVVGDQLNLSSSPANTHLSGTSVIVSTVGFDRTIPAGTEVYYEAYGDNDDIFFQTDAVATLLDGDISIEGIAITCTQVGEGGNLPAGYIINFTTVPFSTAKVTNPSMTADGRSLESDAAAIDRYLDAREASAANRASVRQAVLGLTSGGRTVRYAQVQEPIGMGATNVYIDDGSSDITIGSTDVSDPEILILNAETGEKFARFKNFPLVPSSNPHLSVSAFQAGNTVTISVGTGFLADTSSTWTVNEWAGDWLVDDAGQIWEIASNTATQLNGLNYLYPALATSPPAVPSLGPYSIHNNNPRDSAKALFDVKELPRTTVPSSADFLINYVTGEIEDNGTVNFAGDPVPHVLQYGSVLAFSYKHTSGLHQLASHTLNGVPGDDDFPGVKATGTYLEVKLPNLIKQNFRVSVSAQGIPEAELRPIVVDAVVDYVRSLGIGEDLILSELIRRIKAIPQVYDVRMIVPSSNVVALPGFRLYTDSPNVSVV